MTLTKYLLSTQSYKHEYETGVDIPTQYGYLVETDFVTTERRLKIPTSTENPNGEHIKTGLRGLHVWKEKIFVASWNAIHEIDRESFKRVNSFSHPLMSDLHGIYVDDGGMWLASSLIDSLLHFSHEQKLVNVLSLSNTRYYPRRYRQEVDLNQDFRFRGKVKSGFLSFHINNITAFGEGYLLLTGRGEGEANGRVIRVHRQSLKHKIWIRDLYGPHDGLFLSDGAFAVTETNKAAVAIFRERRFGRPRLINRLILPRQNGKFWTRGLAEDPHGNLMVGRSVWKGDDRKASVVRMGRSGDVLDTYELDLPDYPECRIFQIVRLDQIGVN